MRKGVHIFAHGNNLFQQCLGSPYFNVAARWAGRDEVRCARTGSPSPNRSSPSDQQYEISICAVRLGGMAIGVLYAWPDALSARPVSSWQIPIEEISTPGPAAARTVDITTAPRM